VGIDADIPEVKGAYKNMTTKHPGMWLWDTLHEICSKQNLSSRPALSKPKNIVSVTVNFKDSELLVEVARNLLAASQNQKQFPYKRLL